MAPKASIIILTRNAGKKIASVLTAVFSGRIDFELEVIAVDSGSTDGTKDILAKYPVRLIEIPPAARAPILKAWCQIATSGRKHLPIPHDAPLSAYQAIAADYPVFQIAPVSSPG